MTAPSIFRYEGQDVRTVTLDEETWFFAADVCSVLEITNVSQAITRLDDDEVTLISNEGAPRNVVSEGGLFALILGSRKPEARSFKRWVTHEVLPSIRRTGSYEVAQPESPEMLMARAVIQAQELIARRDEQIAELAPRAGAWDEIASAEGDYSVADAAKMLSRAGIETGPQRLFEQLRAVRWIFRGGDGKWRAMQTAVDAGYVSERPQSHHHPRTGELVLDAPQVRVTLRGVERLRVRLGDLTALAPLEAVS